MHSSSVLERSELRIGLVETVGLLGLVLDILLLGGLLNLVLLELLLVSGLGRLLSGVHVDQTLLEVSLAQDSEDLARLLLESWLVIEVILRSLDEGGCCLLLGVGEDTLQELLVPGELVLEGGQDTLMLAPSN